MKPILFILLFCPLLVVAQQPYSINYTDRDGLPSNELFWVTQGSKGDIWIGSDLGLLRFDGQKFYRYQNTEVQNKAISGIFEDATGTIWCSNFANQIFYIKNDSLYLFDEWEKFKNDKNRFIDFTQGATKDELIIKTNLGTASTVKKGPVIKKSYPSRNYVQINSSSYYSFHPHNGFKKIVNDSIVININCPDCYYSRLNNYNRYLLSKLFIQNKTPYAIIHSYQNAPGPLRNSRKELGEEDKYPFLFRIKDTTMIPIFFPSSMRKYEHKMDIINCHFESDSVIWLATNLGAFRWNFLSEADPQHFFQGEFISDILYDREGSVWLTTTSKGIYFIPDTRIQVLNTSIQNDRPKQLEIINKDQLAIGYGNGIIELAHLERNEFKTKTQQLFPRQIESIRFDSLKNQIWVGSSRLYVLDSSLNILSENPAINSVKKLLFDQKGNIITFRGHAVTIHSREMNMPPHVYENWLQNPRFIYMKEKETLFLRACCIKVPSGILIEDPDYEIWAAYADGLYVFRDTGFVEIRDRSNGPIRGTDMVRSADGSIWVSTLSRGLLQIRNREVVNQISVKDGLPDVYVNKLLVDGADLWLTTPEGIVKYTPKNGAIEVFDEYYGVPAMKINDIAIHKNRLYFTSSHEVLSFDIRMKPSEITAPIARLDDWWVNNQRILEEHSLKFHSYENNIKIKLSATSFKSQGNYRFKYRLKGLHEKWLVTSGNNNEFSFSSLPPGDYSFEASIINKWNIESINPIHITFSILPAFYQTWWFFILMLLLGVGMVALLFWWQLQRIQKRNQEKLERSQLESELRTSQLKALKAQMNPHFLFNALNSIQGLYALNNQLKANQQLSKFSQLVRLTLDLSNETYIPLEAELEILHLYLDIEQTRFMGALEYEFIPPDTIDPGEIYIPSLLIQPYVENAVKHGLLHKEGKKIVAVKMEFLPEQQLLRVIIDDNGIGREASQRINKKRRKHKSFATSANATRLTLLNAERNDSSLIGVEFIDKKNQKGEALGTTVIINIPIHHERNSSR